MNNIIDMLKSFGTGAICGVVFSLLKLPVPAPSVFAGITGIMGIFVGYLLIQQIIK